MVEHFLSRWDSDPSDEVLVLLLRSAATNEFARTRMVTIFTEQLTTSVAASVDRTRPPGGPH